MFNIFLIFCLNHFTFIYIQLEIGLFIEKKSFRQNSFFLISKAIYFCIYSDIQNVTFICYFT